MAIDRSPLQLLPQEASSLLSVGLMHLTFEGLFTPTASGGVRPALCMTMSHDESCCEWRFALKPAQWSNGCPVRAEDFVRALMRAHDPNQPCVAASAVALLNWNGPKAAAEALDDRTLILRWRESTPLAPSVLAMPAFFPMAPAEYGRVGNGPYTVHGVLPGQPLHLSPSATYRLPTHRLPDIYLVPMDQRTALAAALSNQVDWIGSPWGAAQIGMAVEPQGGWRESIFRGRHWVRLNTRRAELQSLATRQSIRAAILEGAEQGNHSVGLLDASSAGSSAQSRLTAPSSRPRLCLLFAPSHQRDMQASLLQKWLRRAGWELELCPVEPKTLARRVAEGDYQMALSSWVAESPLPDEMLRPWLAAGAPGNGTGWHLKESREEREGRLSGSPCELASLESRILQGAAVVPIAPMVMRSWNSPLLKSWELTPLGTFDLQSMGLAEGETDTQKTITRSR
jgi:ABC-type oligopeptide transport system substrate-binding subunit